MRTYQARSSIEYELAIRGVRSVRSYIIIQCRQRNMHLYFESTKYVSNMHNINNSKIEHKS